MVVTGLSLFLPVGTFRRWKVTPGFASLGGPVLNSTIPWPDVAHLVLMSPPRWGVTRSMGLWHLAVLFGQHFGNLFQPGGFQNIPTFPSLRDLWMFVGVAPQFEVSS